MTDTYTAETVTLEPLPTKFGRATRWDVFAGSTVIGRITSPQFGAYIATVNGFEIGAIYDSITVATAAVKVTHDRAAAL